MAFQIRFTVRGLKEMQVKLRQLAETMPKAVTNALRAEAHIEKRESMRRTPWDTKELRKSHRVVDIRSDVLGRAAMGVGVAFGNDKTEKYAWIVHEGVDRNFRYGRAKFLESTLRESAPFMADRVARRLDLRSIVNGESGPHVSTDS